MTEKTPGEHVAAWDGGAQSEVSVDGLVKPTGLARALIGVTGAFSVVIAVLAAYARASVDELADPPGADASGIGPTDLAGVLLIPLLLMSYFLYGLWLGRIRDNREALRHRVGLPAIEWWGWMVPVASMVLVPWGARRIAGRSAPLWAILGWWIAWLGAIGAYVAANGAILAALDLETGAVAQPGVLDASVVFMWATAALTAASWAFLAAVVRRATAHHLDA